METNRAEYKIYCEEVRDVLAEPPKTIYRWGNSILVAFVLILLLISWFIRYPDIIRTEITITTTVPPQKLPARSTGRIEKILVSNNQDVKTHTPLAVIENTAHYKDVFHLKNCLDTLVQSENFDQFPVNELSLLQLGEITEAYSAFEREFNSYKINKDLHPHKITGNAQMAEKTQIAERLKLLKQQEIIFQEEFLLKKADFNRNKKLFEEGVVSQQELESKKIEFLELERAWKSVKSQLSSTQSSMNDIGKLYQSTKIDEQKDEITLYRNMTNALSELKKAISDWELKYVLRASLPGKVSFLQIWTDNQIVSTGENVFVIIPTQNNKYIGKVKAKALNSGKLREGQKVNIHLQNYPDREFGVLEGSVKSISLIPDKDGNLLIDVVLKKGLHTSHNKKIEFHQEMIGVADIVTEDLRLIERILYQIRGIFMR